MEIHCLRQTELPGTSRLFADYQYHFERLARFYSHPPSCPESYPAAASEMRYPDGRRQALVAALRKINGDSPALDRLAMPGTAAVVTGQQVGLFSGPAYTIYKALTAARLAEHLTAQGIPAVPVFWLATEDHDFAEVDHCHVFSDTYEPVTLSARGDGAPQQPAGTVPIPKPPLEELAAALARFPHGDDVLDIVRQAYTPGATLGSAFHRLLARLLSKWNILFLDPLDADVRAIAAPFLAEAFAATPRLAERLLERDRELAAAGYHSQVLFEPETSLVFRLEGNARIALRRRNGAYVSRERSYSPEELAGSPAQLSPNALLRPVVQDYLLPAIAYIGGPAELAYLAQSEVIYRELLGRMPVAVARSGFTLLDDRGRRLMERYGLSATDVLTPREELRQRIARRLIPEDLVETFASSRREQQALLSRLEAKVLPFDPALAKAAATSRAKMEYQLSKLERKVQREAFRRDGQAAAHAAVLQSLIYPDKHLQERYYSILPFLARHGFDLLDTLYSNVHLDCPDHKVLAID